MAGAAVMTWLEWIGIISIVLLMLMGFAVVFMLFLEWWVGRKDLRKAVLAFYHEKLKQEYRKRKRGRGA